MIGYRTQFTPTLIISAMLVFHFGPLLADQHQATDRPENLQLCDACHGEDGQAVDPQWPNLAGQNAAYMAIQLTKYRDGVRQSDVMTPLLSQLSDSELEKLAAWYSQQPVAAAASGESELAARGQHLAGYCVTCHGLSGNTVNTDWPNLAGQQAAYLANRLRAFQSGESFNASMTPVIASFSDADIEALTAYYSQQDE